MPPWKSALLAAAGADAKGLVRFECLIEIVEVRPSTPPACHRRKPSRRRPGGGHHRRKRHDASAPGVSASTVSTRMASSSQRLTSGRAACRDHRKVVTVGAIRVGHARDDGAALGFGLDPGGDGELVEEAEMAQVARVQVPFAIQRYSIADLARTKVASPRIPDCTLAASRAARTLWSAASRGDDASKSSRIADTPHVPTGRGHVPGISGSAGSCRAQLAS